MSGRKILLFMVMMSAFLFSSCEKVIDVNLNDSSPRIIIEGEITDLRGPYKVSVTESKNFDENNSFPGRDDAVVIIKDLTVGVSETLTGIGLGNYKTSVLQGIPGHSYQLTVTLNGEVYTAVSTIPVQEVRLEKLYTSPFELDAEDIFIVPLFTDPVGKGNYYRIKQWVNRIPVKGSYVRSDDASDGRTYDNIIYYSTDEKDGNPLIKNGDLISAELQCIDKNVYDFYRTLNTTIEQDAATPSNPLSNISGGAIGVFNACRTNILTAKAMF